MSSGGLLQQLECDRSLLTTKRIVVLAGGGSAEREISLESGRAVHRALVSGGHSADLLVIGKDHLSIDRALSQLGGPGVDLPEIADNATSLPALNLLFAGRQECVVFTTLHGTVGEDGTWQGLLELLDVPYVSAGVKGSAIAMDKVLTKHVMQSLGLPTPKWWVITADKVDRTQVPAGIEKLVGKPIAEGSSVGVRIVANDAAGWAQLEELAGQYGELLVEEFVAGKEVTAAVVGPSADPVALPLVQIEPTNQFYDYEAKYTSGKSNYTCPADLLPGQSTVIAAQAAQLYSAMDLAPYARIDVIAAQTRHCFLEANTLPGFTENSLLPKAAQAAGLNFTELLEYLLCQAVSRHQAKRRNS